MSSLEINKIAGTSSLVIMPIADSCCYTAQNMLQKVKHGGDLLSTEATCRKKSRQLQGGSKKLHTVFIAI